MNSTEVDLRQFRDREQAGELLADALEDQGLSKPIVFGLARGGVVVAAPVAQRFGVPLEVFVVRKLGAPTQPEYAIGAVAEGPAPDDDVVLVEWAAVDSVGASEKIIDVRVLEEQKELKRRRRLYRGDRPFPDTAGREVVVVDDGIATGRTARAALNSMKRTNPARLILAVPVCPRSGFRQFSDVEVISLRRPDPFHAVGRWYQSFEQVTDDEMFELLPSRARRS